MIHEHMVIQVPLPQAASVLNSASAEGWEPFLGPVPVGAQSRIAQPGANGAVLLLIYTLRRPKRPEVENGKNGPALLDISREGLDPTN